MKRCGSASAIVTASSWSCHSISMCKSGLEAPMAALRSARFQRASGLRIGWRRRRGGVGCAPCSTRAGQRASRVCWGRHRLVERCGRGIGGRGAIWRNVALRGRLVDGRLAIWLRPPGATLTLLTHSRSPPVVACMAQSLRDSACAAHASSVQAEYAASAGGRSNARRLRSPMVTGAARSPRRHADLETWKAVGDPWAISEPCAARRR